MYHLILQIHSYLRWFILIFLTLSIVFSFLKLIKKSSEYTVFDNKISIYTLISGHTQILIGIILFLISPVISEAMENIAATMKDSLLRFFLVEHNITMIIAIVLITIGRVKTKKAQSPKNKFKKTLIFNSIAYLLILWAIPWERLF